MSVNNSNESPIVNMPKAPIPSNLSTPRTMTPLFSSNNPSTNSVNPNFSDNYILPSTVYNPNNMNTQPIHNENSDTLAKNNSRYTYSSLAPNPLFNNPSSSTKQGIPYASSSTYSRSPGFGLDFGNQSTIRTNTPPLTHNKIVDTPDRKSVV